MIQRGNGLVDETKECSYVVSGNTYGQFKEGLEEIMETMQESEYELVNIMRVEEEETKQTNEKYEYVVFFRSEREDLR